MVMAVIIAIETMLILKFLRSLVLEIARESSGETDSCKAREIVKLFI
jgi:hypothetical protein